MKAKKADLWRELEGHRDRLAGQRPHDLEAREPHRFDAMALEAAGLLLDTSRHLVDRPVLDLLVRLAEASDLEARRDAMFAGEAVNVTEGRPALHTALRAPDDERVLVDGRDVVPGVCRTRAAMREFADAVRGGAWRGFSGERIRDVVNLGIGGSDLGQAMAAAALDTWRRPGLRLHFVSNLDGVHLESVLRRLAPETTLFVVVSKTFTTQETLENARTARRWLLDASEDEASVAEHFVAVTGDPDRPAALGIPERNVFPLPEWVGGRYSLWSAAGLALAAGVGMDAFEALLRGARDMDEHFRDAPLAESLPVRMGLLGVWCTDFLGAAAHAVLPYDYALRLLPAHLQQLEMESNGKRTALDGTPIRVPTCPVVWGGPADNGQHAYYQLLHQGTATVSADLIVAVSSQASWADHQDAVLANALAQGETFAHGVDLDEARADLRVRGLSDERAERLAPHLVLPGRRPVSTILYAGLSPEILGALVALYEHKVFVQAAIWDCNPFDQWGVERGKRVAARILPALTGELGPDEAAGDATTRALLARVRRMRGDD